MSVQLAIVFPVLAPPGIGATGGLQRSSGAASTSSSFLDDKLVVNVGVRHDRVRNSDFAHFVTRLMTRNPNGTGLQAYEDFGEEVLADVWTPYREAR